MQRFGSASISVRRRESTRRAARFWPRGALLQWLLVTALLAAMAVQLVMGALADSATTDEPIHILSGYVLLTQHHVLFDPEHPFPFKALTALPLLFLHPKLPEYVTHLNSAQAATTYDTYYLANTGASAMLFDLGNNGQLLLLLPRLVAIAATLLFALVMFLWTRSLFGPASGVLALALAAFDPSFLANGHLANDDTASALVLLLALAAFDRFLRAPSRRSVLLAGLGFGAAAMTKFTLLLLGPIYILLLGLWLWRGKGRSITPPFAHRLAHGWQRWLAGLLAILTMGWLTIWACYGGLMLINPSQNPLFVGPIGNRAIDTLDHFFPAQYARGIGGVAHPRNGYLLGSCFSGSKLDYFPVLAFFKIPIPTLLLIGLGFVTLAVNRRRIGFSGVVLLVPTALFLLASGFAGVDIGFRHALPFYALLLAVAASPVARFTRPRRSAGWRSLAPVGIAVVLLMWLTVETSLAAPYYLPYFNELAGEPRAMPFVASDSNVDWGQATGALADYVEDHKIQQVAFANLDGYAEATVLKMPFTPADPANHAYTGYLAIARSSIVAGQCGDGADWSWVVDSYKPVAVIAGAINLYYLP